MSKFKNYLYNTSYQILQLIVPLITTPYIARVLRADGIGKYSVSFTIAEYFVMFGLLGMASYGSRQIAYVRDNKDQICKVFWNLNFTRWITMIIACVIYFAYAITRIEDRYLYIVQGITVIASLFDISWYYAGLERFKVTAIRNISVKLCSVVLIFLFVKTPSDIVLYAGILSVSSLIGQVVLWKGIIKEVHWSGPDLKIIKTYLIGSISLWLPTIAASVYTSFDKIMISYFSNETEVGLYVNAQKIVKIATTVTTSLAVVMTPSAANAYVTGKYNDLNRAVKKSITAVSFLALPMMFGLMGIRETLVPWFLGVGFESVSKMLLISSLLILSLSWSSIIANQVLVATGNEKFYTIAIISAALLNFSLNLIMIPRYQGMGALFTSVFAEYLGLIIMYRAAGKIVQLKDAIHSVWRYFLAGCVMGVTVYIIGCFLRPTIVSTMFQIGIGVIIYLALLLILGDDMVFQIINIIRPKNN